MLKNNIPIFDILELNKYSNNSDDYKNYLKYLDIYFRQKVKKTDIYNKDYIDGIYHLIDKFDKTKKILIKPTKFIDINEYNNDIINIINDILYKISELLDDNYTIDDDIRSKFNYLKETYILYNNQIKSIKEIIVKQEKKINDLIQNKLNKYQELIKYYDNRKETFNKIKNNISNNIRNKLIEIYIDNKLKKPNDDELSGISKIYNIKIDDLDKWFNWIEYTYLYIKTQNDLYNINKQLLIDNKEYNYKMKYFIMEKPILTVTKEEIKKKIKIKKKT